MVLASSAHTAQRAIGQQLIRSPFAHQSQLGYNCHRHDHHSLFPSPSCGATTTLPSLVAHPDIPDPAFMPEPWQQSMMDVERAVRVLSNSSVGVSPDNYESRAFGGNGSLQHILINAGSWNFISAANNFSHDVMGLEQKSAEEVCDAEIMRSLKRNVGVKQPLQPCADMVKTTYGNSGCFVSNVCKGHLCMKDAKTVFAPDSEYANKATKYSCFRRQASTSSSSSELAKSVADEEMLTSNIDMVCSPRRMPLPPHWFVASPNGSPVCQPAEASNRTSAVVASSLYAKSTDMKPSPWTTPQVDVKKPSIEYDDSSSCDKHSGLEISQPKQNKRKKHRIKDTSKDMPGASEVSNVKDVSTENLRGKRCKNGGMKQDGKLSEIPKSNESKHSSTKQCSKPLELPKQDYVHVRARRGQATDSHSLAERVRREKISERMNFLQDLVPGCSQVTGKALMLDEIINYVQSLQRQVEFLSMKLAGVNPRMEFNVNSLFQRGAIQPGLSPQPPMLSPKDLSPHPFVHCHQSEPSNKQVGDPCPSLDGPELTLTQSTSTSFVPFDMSYGDPASQAHFTSTGT